MISIDQGGSHHVKGKMKSRQRIEKELAQNRETVVQRPVNRGSALVFLLLREQGQLLCFRSR